MKMEDNVSLSVSLMTHEKQRLMKINVAAVQKRIMKYCDSSKEKNVPGFKAGIHL